MDQRAASIRFSAVLHHALKRHLYEIEDLVDAFIEKWEQYQEGNKAIVYAEDENWFDLRTLGVSFCIQFIKEYTAYNLTPVFAESGMVLDSGRIVRPDFIGMDERDCYVYLEYKVTAKPVSLSDVRAQLINGAKYIQRRFDSNEAVRVVVCNFIKGERRIQWHETYVTSEDIEGSHGIQDDFEEAVA